MIQSPTLRRFTTSFVIAFSIIANAATTFNTGTYNIRMLMTEDTGEKDWNDRKDYVFRIIYDNKYDLFGMNEVTLRKQYDDIEAALDGDFEIYGWEGQGGENAMIRYTNLVCWRTSMFECLDKGWFFLAHEDDVWDKPWDNSVWHNIREAAWVKLCVRDTGEILYFVSSHLDQLGNYARGFQAQRLVDKMWKIAGSYPIIVAGDMNSTTSRKNVYNLLRSQFNDTYQMVSDHGYPENSTSGNWTKDPAQGSRIDYIFSRHFKINSYTPILETYGREFTPSDHLPIIANVTIADAGIHTFCVDPSVGDDGNVGRPDAPLRSIECALKVADIGDTIKVRECELTPENTLTVSKYVKIMGGYDETFTNRIGKTTINAIANKRTILVQANKALEIQGLTLIGVEGSIGGGIECKGCQLIARDCDFIGNHSAANGGALQLNHQFILERCSFINNGAEELGGAIGSATDNKIHWYNNVVRGCHFKNNTAKEGSAAYIPKFILGYIDSNTFDGNIATEGSTLYCNANLDGKELGSKLSIFNNTFVNNTAANHSAVYVDIEDSAPVAFIHNTVINNTSTTDKAAVAIKSTDPSLWNNIVACNLGSDIWLSSESMYGGNNLVTTFDTSEPPMLKRDCLGNTFEESAEILSHLLDGELTADKRFIPTLSLSENLSEVSHDYEFYVGTPGVPVTPVVKVVSPDYGTRNLRCVVNNRLKESTYKIDVNYDGETFDSLVPDQLGNIRPTDGTATIGAVECTAPSGIEAIEVSSDFDTKHQYIDMQGRYITNPTSGIYFERRGSSVRKFLIK